MNDRRIWAAAVVVVVIVALLIAIWILPRSSAADSSEPTLVVQPRNPIAGQMLPPQPAQRVPQTLPDDDYLPTEERGGWTASLNRAAWIGGYVVSCDLNELGLDPTPRAASFGSDPAQPRSTLIDPLSQMHAPVQNGRLTFVATEPQGEVDLRVSQAVPAKDPSQGLRSVERAIRVRWSGAVHGEPVACDGVWQPPTGTLRLAVVGLNGEPLGDLSNADPAIVEGCGHNGPIYDNPMELELEVQRCSLRLQRYSDIPIMAMTEGDSVAVTINPGETVELTLRLPPPDAVSLPSFDHIEFMADVFAFQGAKATAEALNDLARDVANGSWSLDSFTEAHQKDVLGPGADTSDGRVEAQHLVRSLADDVEDGTLDIEMVNGALREHVQQELDER